MANKTLAAEGTFTANGIIYTAQDSGATLTLDDSNNVTGISSGKVVATLANNSAVQVTFDASDGALDFTATGDGEVITVTQLFPIEFISGEFTYKGNTISIPAGSYLAIVNAGDGYSLRNENHFVYDSSYIFSGATMTSDSQQVNSHFVLSDGTNTRELDLVQLGKVINNFTERGFTLVKGSSEVMNIVDYTLTATAVDQDAGLNISLGADGVTLVPNSGDGALNISLTRGDTEIISGELQCTKGSITFGFDHAVTLEADTSFTFERNGYTLTATTTDKATTAVELTSDGKIKFRPAENDGGLKLSLKQGNITLFDGELNVSGGTITFDANMQKFSFTKGTTVSISLDDGARQIEFTVVNADASFKVKADGKGNFKLTPDSGDGSLDISIKQGDKTVFYNNISVNSGSIIIGNTGQTVGLTAGASMTVTLGSYTLDVTATDDANFKLGVSSDGSISIEPTQGDGALKVAIKRGTNEIFNNTINVTGKIIFNPATQAITLPDGTAVSLEFNNYTLTATAVGNASSKISFTGDGITITPQTDDGKLKLTLTGTSSGSLSADIEVLSGSFILGEGGALTVAKGTELQIKFSDNYIVNFKATDKAGGSLTLGEDGITFAPGSNDGGLQLSVTRGTDTRSASLDVTGGSVTYKLDGSISLAKGTVVKNVFDDGNILTITANTDASGTMRFSPDSGLTIEPTTTDALEVTLTTDNVDVVKITSIDGSITYSGGVVTASNGTSANLRIYDIWETNLSTSGGSASLQFTDDRTVYTANEGATFVLEYTEDGSTLEIENGTYSDIYATETSDAIELISEGATFRCNDEEFVFTLETAGTYTLNGMNVTTSKDGVQVQLSDYDTITFAADEDIKVSTVEGDKFFTVAPGDNSISFSTKNLGYTQVTDGTIEFDNATKKFSCTAGTELAITRDDTVTTLTAPNEISAAYKVDDGIAYFDLDENSTANIAVTNDGQTTFTGNLTAGGVLSFNPTTGTFGLTGANSSHGDGNNTFAQITTDNGYSVKLATNDTTVVFIPTITDGKLELNFPNENKNAMLFTLGKDGNQILQRQLIINGTIGVDNASQELSLTKDTVLSLSPDGENWLEITATADASGQLTFTEEGIRFAPNAGDGKLQLTIDNRQATLDVSAGAIILNGDGMMSLEKDSVLNLAWEDGTKLIITASNTGGAIGFDSQGLKISSNGELSIDLSTATGVQTTMSKLNGSIHYNAGKVLFDDNSTLTATSSLGGQPTNITLESNGTGGYIEISATGTRYVAGTGALKVTWSRDGKESSFSINSGSVYIGHGIFQIAEGSDLSTDLKDLISTLNFTTTDAGTYTINGQTITTTAENISMTATDDYMTFKTSSDPVTYNGMNFAGNGNVSLSSGGVVLGAGVVADGFGKDKMFILAEAGNVTADARIFELTEDVSTGISVTGAEDGFIFSRVNTEESEARFDDPDPSNVGKIFTEQFFLANDDSYRIQTDLLGLQKIIGVSAPSTVNADATFGEDDTYSIFDIVTESEGTFNIADKSYSISGDDEIEIKARYEDGKASVVAFNNLNGTVSGDFTEYEVSINGSASAVVPIDDTLISIAADDNGFSISGLDDDASLKVAATDSYVVNGTTVNANAGDFIVGNGSAYLLAVNNDTLVTGTQDDDTIANTGSNVTINALGGDDVISLSGSAALVTYANGDGFDTIVGFDSNATLSIGDNEYSTQVSGNDLIITVGESKLTLVDAASLADPNIESTNAVVTLVEMILKRTALGYPLASGLVLNPDEIIGEEPTNYSAKEAWSITSADNLALYGVHYAPEIPNDKWVVLVHGYGLNFESMYPFASFYLVNNYNVLMIDQRAAGNSEGTWLTMGAAESQDVALWTQEIASRYPDSKITLHGVSMGAATAMLAAARQNAVNVTSLIEDCGYSTAMEIFYLLKDVFNEAIKEFGMEEIQPEVIAAMDSVGYGMMGYYLHDAAPIESISSAKMPTLFISGDDDGVVPVSMLSELYDESGAEVKEKFIVRGAGHARAGLLDPAGYSNAVFRFVAEANGEGWETTNIAENISLRGTKYNDTLANSREGVTIDSGEGDDYISNIADNVSISSGDGDDTIYNHGDNITIEAGTGNNSISNNSDNVVFIWNGGNDTIDGFKEDSALQIDGSYSTVKSGSDVIVKVGDDRIVLTGAAKLSTVQIINSNPTVIANIVNDTLLVGTGGDDSIVNDGDNVTIKAYGGDDTIDNEGEYAVIEGSDGADYITNYSPTNSLLANGVSISAGAGNDTIYNYHAYYVTLEGGSGDDQISVFIGNQTYIDGGSGNDTILGETLEGVSSTWAMGGYATINGGDGDDYIDPGFSDSASIMGGSGYDTIINSGDDATINGGAGDDVISLHGASINNNVIKYDVGSGNDKIFGFNETSQLSITAGTKYETQISGDDVLVTVGEDILTIAGGQNTLTIAGGASLSTINIVKYEVPALNVNNTTNDTLITGTELADTIQNSGSNVTISGKASDDSIVSSGANGSLNGDAGNDYISNSGANATVEGYYGDDYLINSGDSVSVSGNYGNDGIVNSGDNVTLSPGSGNDYISNTGDNVVINFTGGSDSVWGFNETSTLNIASGASSVRSDGNITVSIGEDKITLLDAASVVAPNFNNGESIILTKKGEQFITGEKVFELIENVAAGVTLTGTNNGFTSGITDADGIIGVEEFSAAGDDSYNVSISGSGLETISGIDAGANVSTSGIKDGEPVENQFYLVMGDAGSYTLGDLEITATKAGTEILFASDGIDFAADAGIVYDDKTFAGTGNVSISPEAIYLGADVSATGFEDESFILKQKGSTTVDGRTFELTEDVSDGMTIAGADGYTFSHIITQKEATKNNTPSSYIGKTFSENVVVEGDDKYSLQADSFGIRKVSGISDGATVKGGDTSVNGNSNDKYAQGGLNLSVETDSEGAFTIGEKTYSISGDKNVEIKAMFLPTKSYANGFNSLDGTVSGNFDGDEFKVNGDKPILIYGDDSIKVVGSSAGTKLLDVSDGATLASLGGVKEVHTDTEGEFWIGAEPVPFGVTVTGDDNVTFGFDYKGELTSVDNLEGDIEFSKGTGGALSINGIGIKTKGTEFSSIGAYDNSLYIHDIKGGTITAYEPDKIWLQMLGETMTLNGNRLTLTGDADGIWIRDKEIVGLDVNASLQVGVGGDYLANETSLKANAGDVIIGLENDAYIYDASNPLITRKTSSKDIVNIFKPKDYVVVEDDGYSYDITLEGGDLAVVENTPAEVNITAGADTIVSRGEDVHVTLTPEKNTWLFPLAGKMTLEGYDAATGSGFGTTYQDVLSEIEKGTVDFNNGVLTIGSAQVDMGTNSALMNFYNRYGAQQKVGYASTKDLLDASTETKDLVLVAKEKATIRGGSGDDTILASEGSFVDGGAGKNLVKSNGGANIVLSGRTTVENFHTGFGNGTDTIYIAGDPAGVEFKADGLTFGNSSDTVTLSDIKTTAKVNIFHERRDVLNKGVFIAAGDWYTVEESDLAVNEGEEVYFVGTAATPKAGVDFSNVTANLNITIDTAYIDSADYVPTTMWVNGVYSLKGGAGSTTITGSKFSDTILAGTGETSINGGAGHDKLFGNSDANKKVATFYYTAGDGRDSIENFDFADNAEDVTADKVKLDDNSAISEVLLRGSDVMIKLDGADGFLMLEDAQGKSFRLNDDLVAKVDTNVAFDGYTNCYVGVGARATLTVGKDSGNVEVWLSDDSLDYHGTRYDGNFAVLDASQSDGANILAGNELSNVIMGGSGNNSLWGGYTSENDTLIGGTGHNEFYYEQGNGNDVIRNANDGDIIHLGGTLEQINYDGTAINSGGIVVKFNDGGTLNIDGTAEVSFSFDDGTNIKANRQTQQFE